jgi:NADH-ubiquinone oxidoreductase chain 4
MNLLAFIILFPLLSGLLLFLIPKHQHRHIQSVALLNSIITFIASLMLWIQFDYSTPKFQYMFTLDTINWEKAYAWNAIHSEGIAAQSQINYSITFGIDGISLFFILLTTFIIPICILVGWITIKSYVKEYCFCLLSLESLLIVVFSTLDLFFFYVFFEGVVIPMFILIGVWGSRERKIRAAYQFFLYTLGGSILMLLGILLIYVQAGTTDLQILLTTEFSDRRQLLLWLGFFASFAVKIPMMPVHLWLPEAHVEAPTAGSLILAGILLKLGTYGLLRFSIPLFPYASLYFTPLVYSISIIGIIYTSLTTIRQIDLKKIIAYSSVAHMNVVTVGLFSLNAQGVEGSLLLMLAHGIVSPALFLCVDVLYSRHKTRLIRYYGGLAQSMPIFCTFFLIFTMANIALPLSANFVAEFLIFQGAFLNNRVVAFLTATSMILSGAYALWAYNRIAFGFIKPVYLVNYSDLSRREFFMFVPFLVLTFWLGVQPAPFIDVLHPSVCTVLAVYNQT